VGALILSGIFDFIHDVTSSFLISARLIAHGLFYNTPKLHDTQPYSEALIIVNAASLFLEVMTNSYIFITFTVEYLTMAIMLRKA
jgi:hypothetical protein